MSKTVVIGASGALGEHICKRLAADGHSLALVGRSVESLNRVAAQVSDAQLVACDITDDADVKNMAVEVGAVRMLVFLPAAPTAGGIEEAPVEAILRAVDIKVGGLLRCLRALAPASAQQSTDSVAVVVGGNLAYDPIPDAATSGIANAALANAVRQLQGPLAKRGWRIHVVAPGPVATSRWEQLAEAEAERRGLALDDVRGQANAASPLGRMTSTDEVAWAVSILADPNAAALHGSTLLLDTGRRTAIP